MNELFENINEKTQQFFAPVGKVNELVMNNISELVDLQAKALSAYTEMGLDQAKAAMEIRDADSLSAFMKQQSEMAENVQTQFKADVEKLTELANNFSKEIGEAFKDGADDSEPSKPAPKAPAAKAKAAADK